jgi:hypothetical protein
MLNIECRLFLKQFGEEEQAATSTAAAANWY